MTRFSYLFVTLLIGGGCAAHTTEPAAPRTYTDGRAHILEQEFSVPFGYAVYVSDGTALTNRGTISTAGRDAFALYADGDSNSLVNEGTISTTGDNGFGLFASGDSNALINRGAISISGLAHGSLAHGNSNTLFNDGRIVVSNGNGLYAYGDANIVTNRGSITASADDGWGIAINGNANKATVSGKVTAVGTDGVGIEIRGDMNTITVDGSVSGAAYAIAVRNGFTDNCLTLAPGATLSGGTADLFLGTGTDVIVNTPPPARFTYKGTLGKLISRGPGQVVDKGDSIVVTDAELGKDTTESR